MYLLGNLMPIQNGFFLPGAADPVKSLRGSFLLSAISDISLFVSFTFCSPLNSSGVWYMSSVFALKYISNNNVNT